MCIKNYRQFENSTILYDENLTILAGANNTGKTSLIELFQNIFEKTRTGFSIEDIPIKKKYDWSEAFTNEILKIFLKNDTKDFFSKSINQLFFSQASNAANDSSHNEDNKKNLLESIIVDIVVLYDENETISKFSDYLMELDSKNKNFYFRYALEINLNIFQKYLIENFSKIKNKILDLNKSNKKEDNKKIKLFLKEFISELYSNSLEDKYYFSDSTYSLLIEMEVSNFKKLFNCNYISATRILNDEKKDNHNLISKEMISLLRQNEKWDELTKELPDQIINSIKKSNIPEEIEKNSILGLQTTLKSLSETSDGNIGNILLNFNLDNNDVISLFKNVMKARYQYNDIYLKESSQGLGFSNLVYIYLMLEKFFLNIDKNIVNFFIIEEPEAHMHPQMQRALIKYLNTYYSNKEIQGILTTHSNELVRVSNLEKIRVIRQVETFNNQIYDMNSFKNNLKSVDEKNFYSFLFGINYSDIIFSKKIIMYEGDTEKFFIESLLKNKIFENLSNQYISYIQVGGAYAHNYRKLIEFLNIKTLILTDIDYDKKLITTTKILNSETTNSGIKDFYKDNLKIKEISKIMKKNCLYCSKNKLECIKIIKEDKQIDEHLCKKLKKSEIKNIIKNIDNKKIKIKDLYNWKQNKNDLFQIKFQSENDNYTRTLEEAMLCKYLKLKITDEKTRYFWEKIRKCLNLKFSIPRDEKENGIKIRDIVLSTENSKTDFMYSVILGNKQINMLPNYIKEGLEWLEK